MIDSMVEQLPTRRIVVTGSRHWDDHRSVFAALDYQLIDSQFLLAVGDCPTGVDAMVSEWGLRNLAWPVTVYHAPWARRGKYAGPLRNHFMIDQFQPALVLAFLAPDSRGTRDCADYAQSAGVDVMRIYQGEDDGQAAK